MFTNTHHNVADALRYACASVYDAFQECMVRWIKHNYVERCDESNINSATVLAFERDFKSYVEKNEPEFKLLLDSMMPQVSYTYFDTIYFMLNVMPQYQELFDEVTSLAIQAAEKDGWIAIGPIHYNNPPAIEC